MRFESAQVHLQNLRSADNGSLNRNAAGGAFARGPARLRGGFGGSLPFFGVHPSDELIIPNDTWIITLSALLDSKSNHAATTCDSRNRSGGTVRGRTGCPINRRFDPGWRDCRQSSEGPSGRTAPANGEQVEGGTHDAEMATRIDS